jgi:4-hydroxy-2-oxoglutarate aldolase
MRTLEGVIAPVPTPFNENGDLLLEKLQENINRLFTAGVHGVVLLGSNGEYVYLSEEEKRDVIRAGMEAVPKGKLGLAGCGCESTRETLRLIDYAYRCDAAAAMIVNPYYYKPSMTPNALLEHYRHLANFSPIPIMLYSVPKFTGLEIPAPVVAELSRHENVAGIKDSSGNVVALHELLLKCRPDFGILVGTGSALYAAMAVGIKGGVMALANVAPRETVRLWELCRDGHWEQARRLQARLLPVNTAVTVTYNIPGLKAAMDMIGSYGGPPRRPMLPPTQEEKTALRRILFEAELVL